MSIFSDERWQPPTNISDDLDAKVGVNVFSKYWQSFIFFFCISEIFFSFQIIFVHEEYGP